MAVPVIKTAVAPDTLVSGAFLAPFLIGISMAAG